jgi:hypothetical protein
MIPFLLLRSSKLKPHQLTDSVANIGSYLKNQNPDHDLQGVGDSISNYWVRKLSNVP